MTPSYVQNIDESPARPKIIIDTSRGDAATFDPYAIGPARQLRQRKVISLCRNAVVSAVRPRIILLASRGDAAVLDLYAVGPARQLRQRKVFSKVRGPKRAMIETGRNTRRKGPRATGRR